MHTLVSEKVHKVKLGRKKEYAIVDQIDKQKVAICSWHLDDKGYARGSSTVGKRRLHQVIIGEVPTGMVVDHINRDKLDNRRSNLRVITSRVNQYNSELWSHNTSGYKGLYFDESRDKWRVYIGSKFLGRYKSLEQAIKARLKAEEKIYG